LIGKLKDVRWVETNVVAISWEEKPATLNFLVDATAKRKLEEEMVKVQKLESLGVLAGGIAHDFNNILTAILGNIAVARMQGKLPEKAEKRLAEAEKACINAQGLTQQLLTFSKGGTPIKKTARVADLIQDSCPFALRGSNVRCEFRLADDLRTVEIDEGQIGQVVNNLVLNAVHAMPQGGVIQVEAENVQVTTANGLPLKQGPYVKIAFRDHGVGIPQTILPRIFDPYFTTKHKGSGLGLATSYSIVKNHDGLITVESEPGVETVFHVFLPASRNECEIPSNDQDNLIKGAGRVLLMDDEESIRDLAAELLHALGYEVQTAEDGSGAIACYEEAMATGRPFDVVILDLTVPGRMGGAEAIDKLLQIDPDIKAVVSSGYSNDPIMANYEKFGFSGVVAKPYTPKELNDTVIRVMNHS
jgi:nitrogen-specific signal transduction histidine kinase/CheY-like chemotaxis protein